MKLVRRIVIAFGSIAALTNTSATAETPAWLLKMDWNITDNHLLELTAFSDQQDTDTDVYRNAAGSLTVKVLRATTAGTEEGLIRALDLKGLPLGELRLWRHAQCYLCTPLLRSGFESEALEAFLGWLARDSGASLLRLHYLPGEGPFHCALLRHFERHPRLMHFTERYTRALFRPRRSAEGYLRAAVPGRKLKEFRRLARRLADQGQLEYRQFGRGEPAADWILAFLALEERGWKGRAGTALASTPASRAWFERIALEAARRGRLLMHGLYLNGRALALSCKIRAGDGAYAFKIAYDEDYEQFSPGLLLELEQIVRMHGAARIGWLDSCAVPEHFMANRLWLDRRALETVTLAAGGAGALLVLLLPILRWVRRGLARAP